MADEHAPTETAPTETAPAEATTPEAPHPDVRAMEAAQTRGDFREAQAIARRLVAGDDEALSEAGKAMLARFELDPWIVRVLAVTGGLIVVLAGMYLGPH